MDKARAAWELSRVRGVVVAVVLLIACLCSVLVPTRRAYARSEESPARSAQVAQVGGVAQVAGVGELAKVAQVAQVAQELARVRADPALASTAEAIDALVRLADAAPPSAARIEAWALVGEAYANRLGRAADAAQQWEKIVAAFGDDAMTSSVDPILARKAARDLVTFRLARGNVAGAREIVTMLRRASTRTSGDTAALAREADALEYEIARVGRRGAIRLTAIGSIAAFLVFAGAAIFRGRGARGAGARVRSRARAHVQSEPDAATDAATAATDAATAATDAATAATDAATAMNDVPSPTATAVVASVKRTARFAFAYALYVALAGALLASGYESGNARPFLVLGATLPPLLLLARAWAAAGSSLTAARGARAILAAASVLGAAFLVLERTDATYLDGFGL